VVQPDGDCVIKQSRNMYECVCDVRWCEHNACQWVT